MGATLSAPTSEVRGHIISEFVRSLPASRQEARCSSYSLDVRALLRLTQFEEYKYKFAHLPLLYQMDEDKDGRFTLYDLLNLGAYHGKVGQMTGLRNAEVPALVQAFSTAMLGGLHAHRSQPPGGHRAGPAPNTNSTFIKWMSGLIENIGGSYNVGLVRCVPSSSLDFFHGAFHLEEVTREPAAALIANMRLAGLQMGLYSPQELPNFESSIPLVIFQEFSALLLKGFQDLFQDLDPGRIKMPRYDRPFGPSSPYIEEEFQRSYAEYSRECVELGDISDSD